MRDLFDVAGRVVLVTGGSRGIGRMIAQGFVQNGAIVYIASRKSAVCNEAARQLSAFGICRSVPVDLSTTDGRAKILAAIDQADGRLDILVNNAGASWGAALEDYPEHGWDKVLDVNLKSVFFLIQTMLPLLRKAQFTPSRIINIASINGIVPPPVENYAYAASKAAAIMLTRHLAKQLASSGILVNAIAPGPFHTDMMARTLAEKGDEYVARNPLGRLGRAEDIAGTALFLAARASAYMTGAVLPCDGGVAEV